MAAKKPTVAIVMGSKTDWPTLEHTVKTLKEFGVESTVKVMSAHRTPHEATAFAENAAKSGYKVIIGSAGGAATPLRCIGWAYYIACHRYPCDGLGA